MKCKHAIEKLGYAFSFSDKSNMKTFIQTCELTHGIILYLCETPSKCNEIHFIFK